MDLGEHLAHTHAAVGFSLPFGVAGTDSPRLLLYLTNPS